MSGVLDALRRRLRLDRAGLGLHGEALARRELGRRGYVILESRLRSRLGEIDIVARDGPVLAFVEVKTRRSTRFGRPFEAVDRRKREKLGQLASAYLVRKGWRDAPVRFDVVSIELGGGPPRIQVIRGAFEA